MSNSFFFIKAEKNPENSEFLTALELYAKTNNQQVYVITSPLGDNKYNYEYDGALTILIPKHKILFIDFHDNPNDFEEYVENFLEDTGSISDKFKYKDFIDRPRKWRKDLTEELDKSEIEANIDQFIKKRRLDSPISERKSELVISLLIGSINNISKLDEALPTSILDKLKQKIQLLDGDQTRFIYQQPNKKATTIQGLSGTGKTELLLHKLKEIYTEDTASKVILTCHNKVLAASLKKRIPNFFNFMKVEEQIKWDERLWCVSAWGSTYDPNSGAYRYICKHYGLSYHTFSYVFDFNDACTSALAELRAKNINDNFAFDYMLIDESQDFPKSFFDLCMLVTKKFVYIAGDIFQSIFDSNITAVEPDYLLSKCYRTDPRTLMFAHAIGMGLWETPKLRWLNDKELKACGYIVNKDGTGKRYTLTREPLRRFEDLEQDKHPSVDIIQTQKDLNEDAETKIIEIIRTIRKENPTVKPDDIGIIFIDNSKNTYASADRLESSIPREFGWEVNKAHESKQPVPGRLFVSNKNNVKGLEFPFVICVTKRITRHQDYRNALYMMLTRSFLKTYLLTSKDLNEEFVASIETGLHEINKSGKLHVDKPSDAEIAKMAPTISTKETTADGNYYDFVYAIFDELDIPAEYRKKLYDVILKTVGKKFNRQKVTEVAEFNFSQMED